MNTQRRKLRKSEWVILLAPLLVFAIWFCVSAGHQWMARYRPIILEGQKPTGSYKGRVEDLEFSPDGKYLAVVESAGQYVLTLWELQTFKKLWSVKCRSMTFQPHFTSDSKMVGIRRELATPIVDPDGDIALCAVQIFDTSTGALLHSLPMSRGGRGFDFLPDNRGVLISGQVSRYWDLSTESAIRVISRNGGIRSYMKVTEDSRAVAIVEGTQDNKTKEWNAAMVKIEDLSSGRILRTLPTQDGYPTFFSSHNNLLLICQTQGITEKATLWNWRTGQQLWSKTIPNKYTICPVPSEDKIVSIQFNWQSLSSIPTDSKIVLEDLATLTPQWSVPADGRAKFIRFFPNGKWLLDAEGDHETHYPDIIKLVVIRDARTGAAVRTFEGDMVCMPSPDGRFAATSSGNTVKLWDVSDLTHPR